MKTAEFTFALIISLILSISSTASANLCYCSQSDMKSLAKSNFHFQNPHIDHQFSPKVDHVPAALPALNVFRDNSYYRFPWKNPSIVLRRPYAEFLSSRFARLLPPAINPFEIVPQATFPITIPVSSPITRFGYDPEVPIVLDCDGPVIQNTQQGPSPVPEPATMFLFGIGLAGIAGLRIKKLKS